MNEHKQMGRIKQTLICLAVTIVVGLVYFYFELPALNPVSYTHLTLPTIFRV